MGDSIQFLPVSISKTKDTKSCLPRQTLICDMFKAAEDWRSPFTDVSAMVAEARQQGFFIDVRFLVGREGSARYFSAHKMILACGSPVFEAMFFGQLAEKQDPIPIPDDDPDAFQIMLRYLYGEQVTFPSIIDACRTCSIGDKYLIPQLQKMGAEHIALADMDDASFWDIARENLLLSCTEAEDKFRSHLRAGAYRLISSEEFLDASEDIVKMVLQTNEMQIAESQLLCSVTRWGWRRYTEETMWKLQKDLLPKIRFSVLTPNEFCAFHETFPDVLEPALCLRILKHLNDPDTYNLPYWCSTNAKARNAVVESDYNSSNNPNPPSNHQANPKDVVYTVTNPAPVSMTPQYAVCLTRRYVSLQQAHRR